MELKINQQIFKQYKDSIYFINHNGEVYSMYAKKIIKPLTRTWKGKTYQYIDIYDKDTKKQKHTPLHKMVYLSWFEAKEGANQINHKNDNSLDNSIDNLYIGNQKENIQDCINNEHRIGNMFYLTILDKETNKIQTYCPANNFIKICGHTSKNGSISRFFDKKWFNEKYELIEYKKVENLTHFKSVTTMADECKPVE